MVYLLTLTKLFVIVVIGLKRGKRRKQSITCEDDAKSVKRKGQAQLRLVVDFVQSFCS